MFDITPSLSVQISMEASKVLTVCPPDVQMAPTSDFDSQLNSIVSDLSQHVQVVMENMVKMIKEIDQNSTDIVEDIEKCKDTALERKRSLEEQKEHFQKAAYAVLNMLNNEEIS
ncbi:uncharacterized protein LOC115996453 [Ipomoea triloba]|uniref:uncharacterized protein LOC115996453 n=1 Tax=Ipomoea triloba TaxID=35885 RepID=UPI00125E06DB|nr:uncharacterized protein LOC115996453 [Ipomoea triloba]